MQGGNRSLPSTIALFKAPLHDYDALHLSVSCHRELDTVKKSLLIAATAALCAACVTNPKPREGTVALQDGAEMARAAGDATRAEYADGKNGELAIYASSLPEEAEEQPADAQDTPEDTTTTPPTEEPPSTEDGADTQRDPDAPEGDGAATEGDGAKQPATDNSEDAPAKDDAGEPAAEDGGADAAAEDETKKPE